MKLIHGVSLASVALGSVLTAGFSPAWAATQADCAASKTGPVYTDGGQHYVAVCAQGAYAQVNEVTYAPTGGTVATVKTGQSPVDGLFPVIAVPQPSAQCTPKPGDVVVVYTDGAKHYAGVCAGGASVDMFELFPAAGGAPFARLKTGQAPVDTLVPILSLPAPHKGTQCTAKASDLVIIYTDALQHMVGACDASGNNISVGEIMGALTARNNLIEIHSKVANAQIQTQAEGGPNGAIINPKVVVTPAPSSSPSPSSK